MNSLLFSYDFNLKKQEILVIKLMLYLKNVFTEINNKIVFE
ncbi:hypothetical protein GFO_2209 [Christiangramia forsetii KT0803]|uniref:Uncharacterized protein n=1 Tax=Christiangramia forsetii (strain DSM 17595 / CGMCC 1.15422 / KT0803) TaxID=411154 RepID=A0M3H8_CHRFK|nr:hypothetical protein GFO_2209 [Christiangramia forsetii KT0803]